MAPRSSSASARAKGGQASRPKGGPAGRKRTPPPKPPRHIPWGVVGASVVVAIFAIVVVVYAATHKSTTNTTTATKGNAVKAKLSTAPPPWPVPSNEADFIAKAGVPVNPANESFHIHAHLDVLNNGSAVQVPANLGFDQAKGVASSMHTHDTTGVIHLENTKPYNYRLGQFFTEWGVKLTKTQVGGLQASATTPLKFYVDGKPFTGDPSNIALKAHEEIAVVYGTAPKQIPSSYQFPAGE